MNPTDSTNINSSRIEDSLEKAERAVQSSLHRFESAMSRLADKVESTTESIRHVRDIAKRPKEDLMALKSELKSTLEPMRPYLDQARSYSRQAVTQVKENPRPYLAVAVGLIGGFLLINYFQRRGTWGNRNYSSSSTSDDYTYVQ